MAFLINKQLAFVRIFLLCANVELEIFYFILHQADKVETNDPLAAGCLKVDARFCHDLHVIWWSNTNCIDLE